MTNLESPQTYKTISQRARLLLKRQEDSLVDFKETVRALSVDDLVAMANVPSGGALLLGVREGKDEKGLQKATIVGCPVDDGARLSVVNKAQSAHPPIAIQVFLENLNKRPFLRVEVLPSNQRPHCTPAGRYAVRTPGRNAALLPPALLQMFLEDQGQAFISRFRDAAAKLEKDLEATKDTLEGIGVEMVGMLDSLERQMDAHLSSLHATTEDGAFMAEEAQSNSDHTAAHLVEVDEKIDAICTAMGHQGRMLDMLADKMGLPQISRLLKMDKIIGAFGGLLIRNGDLPLGQLIRKAKSEKDPRLMIQELTEQFSQDELEELRQEALRQIAPFLSHFELHGKRKPQRDTTRPTGQKKRGR